MTLDDAGGRTRGRGRHAKYSPYAFTEQGVAMLSSVLKSERAVQVNVEIMRAFVRLRGLIGHNSELARRRSLLCARATSRGRRGQAALRRPARITISSKGARKPPRRSGGYNLSTTRSLRGMALGIYRAAAPGTNTEKPADYTGILPSQKIREMLDGGEIKPLLQPIEDDQVQPASIDLRLGQHAFPIDTSFLPGKGVRVLEKMKQLDERYYGFRIDLGKGAVLEKGRIYVIPLLESIHLRSEVAAFANPKSSTGRLDILTRLIADGATVFDQVAEGYKGELYLEVAPRSFSVVVKTGTRLNQLRFRRTRGEAPKQITAGEWKQLLDGGQVVELGDSTARSRSSKTGVLPFTVDLEGTGVDDDLIGYRAKKHSRRIDLERRDYDPLEFWEPIRFHKTSSLVLDPDEFYILVTREAIAVPPDYAAEMLPYDTRAGEFRVHYAGFFDPGFGWDPGTGRAGGSRGVLEVRSHEVPFLLEHGQTVGWLRYERMAARPERLYGGQSRSHYQGQGLKLAKQFTDLRG